MMKPNDLIDLLNITIEKTRKQTAKETLQKVRNLLDNIDQVCSNPLGNEPIEWGYSVKQLEEGLDDLAKQLGVEVE